jgi:hypothetical protein
MTFASFFDLETVEVIHSPSTMAVGLANYYQVGLSSELKLLSKHSLFQSFSSLLLNLCRQTQVEPLVAGLASREQEFLTSVHQVATLHT